MSPDPEHSAVIGVDADPGTGKSTLIKATIQKMLEGVAPLSDRSLGENKYGRKIAVWNNYLSVEDGLQIRNFDSCVIGPYFIPNTTGKVIRDKVKPLPERV